MVKKYYKILVNMYKWSIGWSILYIGQIAQIKKSKFCEKTSLKFFKKKY